MTPAGGSPSRDLRTVFERARDAGLLGPVPVESHLLHAEAFGAAIGDPGSALLDLGSGAGVPGLALAARWPALEVALLEGRARRAGFLQEAVEWLGLESRVSVIAARAEDAGHDVRWRGVFDTVTARAFGAPAVTAECAAAFLRVGGRLVVAEPPPATPRTSCAPGRTHAPDPTRWPVAVECLGLVPRACWCCGEAHFQVLDAARPCPVNLPRRVGVPQKRPLF